MSFMSPKPKVSKQCKDKVKRINLVHRKGFKNSYCEGLTGSPGNGTRFAFFSELLSDCALSLAQHHVSNTIVNHLTVNYSFWDYA